MDMHVRSMEMRTAILCGLVLAGLLASSAEARSGGSMGGSRSVIATFPFQTTVRVARQQAAISRFRAQQAIANQITASGGLVSGGFFGDGFVGGVGFGGIGFGGGGIGGGGQAGSRASSPAHPRVINVSPSTTTTSTTTTGQIEIVRGTSVEIVPLQ
jgi:hypothetical protein